MISAWRRWLPYLTLVALATMALRWQLVDNPAHQERDAVQERLDQASAPLRPGHTIGQTFLSRHAGLRSVEILLVVYDPAREIPPSGRLTLTLEGPDELGGVIAEVERSAAGLKHNQRLSFSFEPLADSENASYRFTLSCDGDYGLGCWHTTSDAYAHGEMLENGQAASGDLYFVTTYDYHLTDALHEATRALWRNGRSLPALLLLLVLPGLVMSFYLFPCGRLDTPTCAALIVALSGVFWPLLLLWASVVGLSLAGSLLWGVIAGLWLLGLYGAWSRRGRRLTQPRGEAKDHLPDVALLLVMLLIVATRVLHVRDLVVPAWVDSLHHTVVAQIISEVGMVPSSCEPYLTLSDFHYHFGFHANVAVLMWLSGLPSHRAVLMLGQVVNVMTALSVCALASWLTKERWAGVGAALVAGLLSNMPAYYVSWGRYTQLTGLMILPPLCLVATWLLESRTLKPGLLGVVAILAAGLALTHYRVLAFYLLFLLAYVPLLLWRARFSKAARLRLAWGGLALGALALLGSAPWLVRLLLRVVPQVEAIYGGWEAPEGYNAFPGDLLKTGWFRRLVQVAGAGAIWGLLRRRGEILVLVLWVSLWFLVANLHLLGLHDIWLIHNSSVVISLWMPLSLLCGWLAADLAGLARRGLARLPFRLDWSRGVSFALFVVAVALASRAAWGMVDIINEVTVLVTPDDVRAISWVRENTPPEARFLINTRVWTGDLRVGSDAGWWLPLLAGRDVTLPCVLYHQGSPEYRDAIVDLARTVEEAESLDDPDLLARLKREGITHVFSGARGGRLMPRELDPSPHYELRYASGPARVYEFVPDPS